MNNEQIKLHINILSQIISLLEINNITTYHDALNLIRQHPLYFNFNIDYPVYLFLYFYIKFDASYSIFKEYVNF